MTPDTWIDELAGVVSTTPLTAPGLLADDDEVFTPQIGSSGREEAYRWWRLAVDRSRGWAAGR